MGDLENRRSWNMIVDDLRLAAESRKFPLLRARAVYKEH